MQGSVSRKQPILSASVSFTLLAPSDHPCTASGHVTVHVERSPLLRGPGPWRLKLSYAAQCPREPHHVSGQSGAALFPVDSRLFVCAKLSACDWHHEAVAFFRWRATRQPPHALMTCRIWQATVSPEHILRLLRQRYLDRTLISKPCRSAAIVRQVSLCVGSRMGVGHEAQAWWPQRLDVAYPRLLRRSFPGKLSSIVWGSETYPTVSAHSRARVHARGTVLLRQ